MIKCKTRIKIVVVRIKFFNHDTQQLLIIGLRSPSSHFSGSYLFIFVIIEVRIFKKKKRKNNNKGRNETLATVNVYVLCFVVF